MVGFWNAMPTIDTGSVTSSPATVTTPCCGSCSPVTSFISVDLPQPDGPTTATNSPFSTRICSPATANVPVGPP